MPACFVNQQPAQRRSPRWSWPALSLALAALLPAAAQAQSHDTTAHGFTLRSSTVNSQSIDPTVAAAHKITPAPDLYLISISINDNSKSGGAASVPAKVSVHARDMAGRTQEIKVTQERDNGYLSYMGTYQRLPKQTYAFDVTATPQGTSHPLELHYQDMGQGH